MKSRNIKLIALMATLASGSAFASTQTFTHNTATATGAFTDNFFLSGFNTSLGTLTSVNILLTSSVTGQVNIFNNTSVTQAFTNASASVPVSVAGPDGTTTSQTATAFQASGTVNPGTNSFPGLTGTQSSNVSVVASNFYLYQSVSPLNLAFALTVGNGTFSGSSVAGVFFSGNESAGGTTAITYTYEAVSAVPVPAAIWMFGGGLLSMLSLVRRKAVAA